MATTKEKSLEGTRLCKPKEVARFLGCGEMEVRRIVNEDGLPAVGKPNGVKADGLRIDLGDLWDWQKKLMVGESRLREWEYFRQAFEDAQRK